MHGIWYSLLIALANNVDNIGVRIAYSIRGIRLDWRRNLWISVITFAISAAAAAAGGRVSAAVGARAGGLLSFALLTLIGLGFILEPLLRRLRARRALRVRSANDPAAQERVPVLRALADPEQSDLDHSKSIDFREATLLGVSLSVNNIGGSLSAGMIGLNSLLIGVLSAAVSFLALWAGNYLTALFARLGLGRKATVAAGVILILIGVRQLF